MKSHGITIVLLLISLADLNGQWEIVNEGINYRLTPTIDFINSDTGWIAGKNVILKTKDGGTTWVPFEKDTTGDFRSVDFINDSLGWGICDTGIVKTLDEGRTWIVLNDTVGDGKIMAVTENIVFALVGGEILKTSNGGTDWESIYSSNSQTELITAFLYNTDTVIIAGGKDLDELKMPNKGIILRTNDGGESWIEVPMSPFNNVLDVKLINDSAAFFLATDKSGKFYICKTIDAFSTWSVLTETIFPVRASMFFDDGIIIYIVENNLESYIMKSTDEGLTWEKGAVKLPLNWNYEICFGAENAGYILGVYQQQLSTGNAHILVKSTDFGINWSYIKLTQPFQDVSFIDANTGIIVSCDAAIHYRFGNIFNTDDGGKTWNNVFSGNSNLPVSCQFVNDSGGFILTYNYEEDGKLGLLQTSDSGKSWIETSSLLPYPLPIWGWIRDNGRLLMNEHMGYIAANERIYQTTDMGESWETIFNCDACELNSLFFAGEAKGWAVGESGTIYKYSAPGEWDEIDSGTDLPLKKVFFADGNTGWIAGGFKSDDDFRPVLLKTENGGDTWTNIENVDYLVYDIYFKDSRNGWAVGEDKDTRGIILATTDGGDNWTIEVDSLNAPLNAIYYKDGYVWAVGMNGYILKILDSTSASLFEDHIKVNDNDIAVQNYPNPFRSRTVILYRLSVNSKVELTMYDIMGRKVSTLVKEKQQAGSHEAEWNAHGIRPGIYFCELKAGQNRKIFKMVLIE